MATSINLIPQQEQQEQQKSRVVKLSTIVSIAILVVVGLIAGYYYYAISVQKSAIKVYDNEITTLRSNIENLSELEIVARNLDTKYKTLRTLFSERSNYSILLTEFNNRIPENVEVDSLSMDLDNKFTITGSGSDYLAISAFVNSLKEEKLTPDTLNGLFTGVSLNSVNLDRSTGNANYFVVVDYDRSQIIK